METAPPNDRSVSYLWASDPELDGIRLEVNDENGDMIFDITIPDEGTITVNTFGVEVAAELIETALQVVRSRG